MNFVNISLRTPEKYLVCIEKKETGRQKELTGGPARTITVSDLEADVEGQKLMCNHAQL